jgi:hypothetical protein
VAFKNVGGFDQDATKHIMCSFVYFELVLGYRYINFFPSVGLFVLKMCHSNVTAITFICRDHRLESVLIGMRYMVQQTCY